MSTLLITLKTNHTLIGDVEKSTSDFYIIKKPAQVAMQPTPQGKMLVLVPFIEFAEEFETGFKISVGDVLFVSTPVRELVNNYNEALGSGIEIASTIPKI